MNSDQAKAYIYLGGAVVVAYLVYRAASGAAKVAGAVGDAVGAAAGAADTAISTGVGGIGSVFGLPTPDQTIDDPKVVRWIIDNQGQFEASKQGTAWAYIKAQALPSGSGTPPASAQSVFTPDQMKNITAGLPAGQINTGDILSGPSFSDLKNNPYGWLP